MKTLETNGTKKGLALAICEAYERFNANMEQQVFDKVLEKLERKPKAILQRYIEYIENGEQPNIDAAFCIALGTGIFLKVNK